MIREENEGGEKYLAVETEDDFHEALNRGLAVELTWELGEQIGLMVEDGGGVESSCVGEIQVPIQAPVQGQRARGTRSWPELSLVCYVAR